MQTSESSTYSRPPEIFYRPTADVGSAWLLAVTALIHEIRDTVPQMSSTALEFGRRAQAYWVGVELLCGDGSENAGSGDDIAHVFRIVLPIGRDVQKPAGFDNACEFSSDWWLDESAFVVALLRPGVGKEQVHTDETRTLVRPARSRSNSR